MKKFLALIIPALFLVPMVASAASGAVDLSYFTNAAGSLSTFLNIVFPVLVGIAVLAILLGLAKYAFAAGNEEAQKDGRRIMVTGVIILFVMVSIWGLVGLLTKTTGIEKTPAPDVNNLAPTVAPSP